MTDAGACPHPEKRLWPLRDAGGLHCTCGHAWQPYEFVATANLWFEKHAMPTVLEVYQCRTRGGRLLDHWHTTDVAKRRPTHDHLDESVKDGVVSTQEIQTRWSGRRKGTPLTRAERRRYRRHRVSIR